MDNNIKEKIFKNIDLLEDELVQFISKIVQIKSATPEFNYEIEETKDGETKVNQYTKKAMDDMGLTTDLYADVDSDICKLAQSSTKEISPDSGEINGMFAVCDGSFIFEKGIPVVVLGAGETKYTHAVNEKIEIKNVMDICKIYALMIADWCGI